jgi:hypothetical protein
LLPLVAVVAEVALPIKQVVQEQPVGSQPRQLQHLRVEHQQADIVLAELVVVDTHTVVRVDKQLGMMQVDQLVVMVDKTMLMPQYSPAH